MISLRRKQEVPEDFRGYVELQGPLAALADAVGWPKEWLICPSCAAFSWRLPPHGLGEPCPLSESMAQSAGLKLDAERSTAIRTGVILETQAQAMSQFIERFTEDEDDE